MDKVKKKILVTKDGRKKSDITIGDAGKISFSKDSVVIGIEDTTDSKAAKLFLMKVKHGNPDAEIIFE